MVDVIDQTPRPRVTVDPGVRARPTPLREPTGDALDSFSRQMGAISGVFANLNQKRQAAEDSAFADAARLEFDKAAAQIEAESLNSPDISNPKFVDILDKRLADAEEVAFERVIQAGGFTPSEEGRRRAARFAIDRRISTARSATGKAHNQRVEALVGIADDNVNEIIRLASAEGDIDGGLTKIDTLMGSLAGVVAPSKARTKRNAYRAKLVESVVEGHLARQEYDEAQAIVDRETGFVKEGAGEVETAIITAAKEEGADPAVVLAIALIESGGDPKARPVDPDTGEPLSTAQGIFQLTVDTADSLGVEGEVADLPVEEQAQYGATLTASNTNILRRALGGEPTPGEIYLAHFLGVGAAKAVLGAEEGTALTELLADEAFEANTFLKGMTASSVVTWAGRKMQEAMGTASGSIDGRKIANNAATIPIGDAVTLSKRVRSARRDQKVSLDGLIDDDVRSIRSTGEPIGIDEDVAQSVLTPREMANWQADREDAGTYYEATHDMTALPEQEINRRVSALEPRAGEVGFARSEALHADVKKEADRIKKLRIDDPALSIAETPEVKAAAEAFDSQNLTESWEQLIKARLGAQKSIGIDDLLRAPLTKAEAKRLATPIRTARKNDREFIDRFEEMVGAFDQAFGEFADEALKQIVLGFVKDEDRALMATRIIRNLVDEREVPISDAQAFDEAAENAGIDAVADSLSDEQKTIRALRGDPEFVAGQDAAAKDALDGRLPLNPLPPDQNAIQFLRDNPDTLDDFIAIYGEDQVPADMRRRNERR